MAEHDLTAEERSIMEHALGWQDGKPPKRPFRNRYVMGLSCDGWAVIQGMCSAGLMQCVVDGSVDNDFGGMSMFQVTEKGRALLAEEAPRG